MTWDQVARRGQLIDFKCHFDGKTRVAWRAIYHGNNMAHVVGKPKSQPIALSGPYEGDVVTPIRHGISMLRSM